MSMVMTPRDIRAAVDAATQRIRSYVLETPLRPSAYLSRRANANVLCKLENVQITGSFKARGAASKLTLIPLAERRRGIVTASSGNHGAAVTSTLARIGGRAVVFVPTTTPRVKIEAMEAHGADIRRHSEDSGESELAAIAYATAEELPYVSPYNDPDVIAGQGTIGAELERQAESIDHVFVSVGGGGLISGVAGYLKGGAKPPTIWGVSPANDHSMRHCVLNGEYVPQPAWSHTLSDGTAGTVEPGAITIGLCKALVDHWPTVSENEIASAMRGYMRFDNQLVEGAAGVAIAGFLQAAAAEPEIFRGKTVVIIICGARIDADKLVKILKQ